MNFNLNFNHFLSVDYWLTPNPDGGQLFFLILSFVLTLKLFILGLLVWWVSKKYFTQNAPVRKLLGKVMTLLFSFCGISLFLIPWRLMGLGWITARIIWPVLLLILLFWLGYYLFVYFSRVPTEIRRIEQTTLKNKYLRKKVS